MAEDLTKIIILSCDPHEDNTSIHAVGNRSSNSKRMQPRSEPQGNNPRGPHALYEGAYTNWCRLLDDTDEEVWPRYMSDSKERA